MIVLPRYQLYHCNDQLAKCSGNKYYICKYTLGVISLADIHGLVDSRPCLRWLYKLSGI